MSKSPSPIAQVFAVVCNLCRFRGGPQDLPSSASLLTVLLVASVCIDFGFGSLLEFSEPLLARSLLSLTLLLALSWTALAIRGLAHRFVQTSMALVACAMAFSFLILPLALLFGNPQGDEAILTRGQTLIVWLGLGTLIWKIAVDAHIVRQAIDAPYWLGFLLALSWTIADFALSRVLFSAAA